MLVLSRECFVKTDIERINQDQEFGTTTGCINSRSSKSAWKIKKNFLIIHLKIRNLRLWRLKFQVENTSVWSNWKGIDICISLTSLFKPHAVGSRNLKWSTFIRRRSDTLGPVLPLLFLTFLWKQLKYTRSLWKQS